MASNDSFSIVVYQAYGPEIGRWAVDHGEFGGGFKFSRMSWIKPNFLWMMRRSNWGKKSNQEVILAITIPRTIFDYFLRSSVPSSFNGSQLNSVNRWRRELKAAEVILQWDPDYDPFGKKLRRKAVQIGLRGDELKRYAEECIISIEDISERVSFEAEKVLRGNLDDLLVPNESVYVPPKDAAKNIGLEVE